jgi:hypothetical protein
MNLEGFEFDHIVSRKGKDIMLGQLQDYVEACIDNEECSETKDHYICQCPYCKTAYLHDHTYDGPYTKYKLYVKKDKTTGFCFRCDQAYVNASNDDQVSFKIEVPEPEMLLGDFELTKLDNSGTWRLDMFDDFDKFDAQGFEYLVNKRHSYFNKLADLLNIRYSNHNPVIPFYYRGELIFYQFKIVDPKRHVTRRKNSRGEYEEKVYQEPKYFTPPIDHKPPYVIEHGNNKKFIICEGTFDAIALLLQAPSYTPFALLGSSITDYQLAMLRTYIPEKIIVYMDETELSKKVVNRLNAFINYADISIIYSNGEDPEERLKRLIAEEQNIQWIK